MKMHCTRLGSWVCVCVCVCVWVAENNQYTGFNLRLHSTWWGYMVSKYFIDYGVADKYNVSVEVEARSQNLSILFRHTIKIFSFSKIITHWKRRWEAHERLRFHHAAQSKTEIQEKNVLVIISLKLQNNWPQSALHSIWYSILSNPW